MFNIEKKWPIFKREMMITFYLTDKKGQIRYYSIHDRQNHLFSKFSFTAMWGKVLNSGREKVYVFSTRKELDDKLRFLFHQKIRQGYKVLYSFSRKKRYKEMFGKLTNTRVG